jgi:serine/threonine protein kinase/sugar lactone lactonase YvrE
MLEPNPQENQPVSAPPISAFTGPVAELIAQRMLLPPLRPGLLAVLDRFEIVRILGSGGMGMVFLARDRDSGREVALKLVKAELVTNLNIVHRFFREAGHLKRLRHPNIVSVEAISERVEFPYFVMPFFERGSLAGRIKPGQALNVDSILDIAIQVAEGLIFAHRSGIIHRDLKPANILLGANGQVCLADFGLARTMFNDTVVDVESRQLEGTAPYMSPAVAAGEAEDTRCDIYSFGAVLYEMLTGHPPYKGRNTKEILDQILAGPPKSITSLNASADRGLVAVAEKAMARELRDRYADMRDALKDLQSIKEGNPPMVSGHKAKPAYLWITVCLAGTVCLGWLFWPKPTAKVVVSHAPVNNALPLKLSTLAGEPSISGQADGPGTQAQFNLPNNIAVDKAGNVYVADTANNTIRKIAPNGLVTTLAGLAGSHGSADGVGSQARFWAPFGIAVNDAGNLFVADTANNVIREITPNGVTSTLAGAAGHPGSKDGMGSEAQFRNPWGVTVDSLGNVLVADMSNNTIRKITPAGAVTTLAGQAGISGNVNGLGNTARFNHPFAVAVDSANNIYVSDTANNAIRKITPSGTVVTIAGLPDYVGNADGNGNNARFSAPQGLAVDSSGNIYVADTGNNVIREITPAGTVKTLPARADVAVTAKNGAELNSPQGVALDGAGNIYVADTGNQVVRKITLSKPAIP